MNLKDYNAGRKVTGGTHAFESKLEELDHVYSQAALNKEKIKQIEETYKVRYSEHIELKRKADEYEAKAKAFDEIFKLYIGYEDGWIHFPRGSKSFNKEIISVCKSYESGEPND